MCLLATLAEAEGIFTLKCTGTRFSCYETMKVLRYLLDTFKLLFILLKAYENK